jgi:7,8-dihydropterin-6-yl-methyl-4-(beta-D-ribofuranosyl)aminobenzene 5'-phosphate synthase
MNSRRHDRAHPVTGWAAALLLLLLALAAAAQAGPDGVTILTDAFGRKPGLALDWGYSALIEYQGRRILFDAGDNAVLLKRNVERLHVDLAHLDLVVISHAHGDHTSGLRYVLSLNPDVPLYVPDDVFFRGHEVPRAFLTTNPDPSLPPERRYFGGNVPDHVPDWQGWNDTNLTVVTQALTIAPGIRLVALTAEKPPFAGMPEVSLCLDTPEGPVILVGCSHPGIERILAAATADEPARPVYLLFGGLHLVQDTPAQIAATLGVLADTYHVRKMAVGHCTGELTFSMIHQRWGANDLYAGLGEFIAF